MTIRRLPRLGAVCCSLLLLTVFLVGTESASCCVGYSKLFRCKNLIGYTIQNISGSCDIPAVIFHGQTPGKKFVCADPSERRTKHVMKCLDRKKTN